ncbi:hypothetical protein BD414DRAFT_451537 [Trametes punicea]|nr:hypothetical protein BD414DRAFT_451537 [Trametes punicea]
MSSPPDGHPPKNTAGPILIQGFLQYLCQGDSTALVCGSGVKFYHRWKDDPVALRVYVIVLVLFSLVQTVLESYKTWVEVIEEKHWWTSRLHFTEFFCNAVICSLCEAFLIRRCYRITQRSLAVLIPLASLLVTTTVASVLLTVRIAKVVGPFLDGGNADPLHASKFAYPLWVYGTLAMALSLTTILSVSLWRTRTGLRHLDRTLTHVISITFESAALPTLCALASAIIFPVRNARRDDPVATAQRALHLDLFFAVLIGKAYTLGILRTLNSRAGFRASLLAGELGRRSLTGWEGGVDEGGRAGGPRLEWQDGRGWEGDGLGVGEGLGGGTEDVLNRSSEETVRAPEMGHIGFGEALAGSCVTVQVRPFLPDSLVRQHLFNDLHC